MKYTKNKSIFINLADQRIIGDEPEWKPNQTYKEIDFIRAYNWYNYVVTPEQRLSIIAEYVSDSDKKYVLNAKTFVPNKLVALCRMRDRGMILSSEQENYIKTKIEKIINSAKIEEPIVSRKTILPASIGDLEHQIDLFLTNKKSDFVLSDWYKTQNLNKRDSNNIAAYYSNLLNELELAIHKKDKEVVEAYSHHSSHHLKKYHALIQEFVNICSQKKIVVRKARKPKKIDVKKLVKRVQYQKEEKTLNLESIDPIKLLNAREAYLYNTKTRMLQYYVTNTTEGLTIKGCSIDNFSEASEMRKIRKPELLRAMLEQAPKTILHDFKSLKVKPANCNGRLNKYTLILRINK